MSEHRHATFTLVRDPITGELIATCTGCGEIGRELERPAHEHAADRTWLWPDGSSIELCSCGLSRLFVASRAAWTPWRRGV